MRSRTSFFNGSIFKKSMSRFWPVWGGYFAVWLIALPVMLLSRRDYFLRNTSGLREYILQAGFAGGLILSGVFAAFSAMAVWSFAYNTRSAHGTACLPVRREGIFASVTLAGAVPYLAVNAAVAVLALLAELSIGVVDLGATLQWFALATLPFLLFYGFATFCAQLTGNILVLPAVYAVLNFVFVGVEVIVRALGNVFVYGVSDNMEAFTTKWLSPVVAILMRCGVNRSTQWNGEEMVFHDYAFQGWSIYILYAVVGLVFLALALLLFRRRKMETAGDVVAIDVLKPVFRWCMAIGCALCLAALFYLVFGEFRSDFGSAAAKLVRVILILFVGAFIGWFAAEMLMKKSFRVFRGGWKGLGLCCLILAALLCACEFDLFGYERYVPKAESVEYAELRCGGQPVTLDRPESIEMVTALHAHIIANKKHNEQDAFDLYGSDGGLSWIALDYTLRGGRRVSRSYRVRYSVSDPAEYGDVGLAQTVLNCPEAISDRKDTAFPITAENIYSAEIITEMTAADCAAAAGYAGAEEYVLREFCGVSSSELDALDAETREAMLRDAVFIHARGGYELETRYAADGRAVDTAAVSVPMGVAEDDFDLNYDIDKVIFTYTWHFTPKQIAELYDSCIVPDIEDGTLGRVWIITDAAYEDTVYSTSIRISARMPISVPDSREPYNYEDFYTTPTVDSARTNAWLAAHGVTQYTLSQLEAMPE